MAGLVLVQALLLLLLFFIPSYADDSSTSQQLLKDINAYRSGAGVAALRSNEGAGCLAEKLAEQLDEQDCNNVSLAQTSPGLEPDFPNYPTMLSQCKLDLQNTTDGQVLVDCIPPSLLSTAAAVASQNFTLSQQYQLYLNSSDYNSVGIASHKLWFVLVLAKNTSQASFALQQSSSSCGHSLLLPILLLFPLSLLLLMLLPSC